MTTPISAKLLRKLDQYPFLNLGGGNFDHHDDGWLNLDYTFDATARKRDWGMIDVVHNLMTKEPIPLPDNCMEGVYSEHTIEHLPDDVVVYALREVYRILRPGGTVRIAVPDADKFWAIVKGEDRVAEEFPSVWRPKYGENTKEQVFLDAMLSPLRGTITDEEVREIVGTDNMEIALLNLQEKMPDITVDYQQQHPGAHVSWWNLDKLWLVLDDIGFDDIRGPLDRNESRHKIFRNGYIDRTAFKCTVRVEASKP